MAGDWQLVFNEGDPALGQFGSIFQLRYVNPVLPLFDIPPATPTKIRDCILSASEIIWVSPSSAANRLRFAVEEVLTAEKVPPLKNTHARIEIYSKYKAELADALMAVKWIGNLGSHDDVLTTQDVFDGVEILSHVVTALYGTEADALAARIKAINDAKGVPTAP